MGQRVQETQEKARRSDRSGEATPEGAAPSSAVAKKGKKLAEGIDKILDEIDGVLEENAEELVKSYVQRGGE